MIDWALYPPPGDSEPGWLADIREFRASVLYDGGRRPAFRGSDGRFVDADPLDIAAHHLVARVAGAVLGCVRILPVSGCEATLTEHLIGSERFAGILRNLGVDRSASAEGGRWVVDPAHRSAALSGRLAAGGVAVARALGFKVLFCPAGTRAKQDRVLAYLGLTPVPGVPLIQAPEFNDELRLVHVRPGLPPSHLKEMMNVMAAELQLPLDRTDTFLERQQSARLVAASGPAT